MSQQNQKNSDYDIIVVGAGLVGTSFVVALQSSGLRIAVLEKHLPDLLVNHKADARPLTLAYGSQQLLKSWGIWPKLEAKAMPIQQLHVSEQGRLGRVLFSAQEEELSALGFVVSFTELQAALYHRAEACPNVDFIAIDELHNIVNHDDSVEITYKSAGESYQLYAKLLVAADGSSSTCRQLMNISAKEKGMNDVAWIASVRCQEKHNAKAYQRFTKQGSLALLPLFDEYEYRLVWTMTRAQKEIISSWSDEHVLEFLSESYGGRLGELLAIRREAEYPLSIMLADETIKNAFVLLGNAAHTFYPVAAQGFNLSLQDVASLSRIINRAEQQGEPIGGLATLQRYLKACEQKQQAIVQWSERVSHVFYWDIPLLDHMRGLALLSLDTLLFLKQSFSRNFLYV